MGKFRYIYVISIKINGNGPPVYSNPRLIYFTEFTDLSVYYPPLPFMRDLRVWYLRHTLSTSSHLIYPFLWRYYFISQTLMRRFIWKSFLVRNFFTSFSCVSLTRYHLRQTFIFIRDMIMSWLILMNFIKGRRDFGRVMTFVILGTSRLKDHRQISLLLITNVSLMWKPGSWFLLAKCLKNTCGRVIF